METIHSNSMIFVVVVVSVVNELDTCVNLGVSIDYADWISHSTEPAETRSGLIFCACMYACLFVKVI